MSRLVCICIALALLAPLASCAKKEPVRHTVTEKDNGGSVTMAVGDELQITLPGSQFKGHEWVASDYDPNVFVLMHENIMGRGQLSTTTGGAVPELVLFRAKKEGKFTLKMMEQQPGTAYQDLPRFTLTVTVVKEIKEQKLD